MADIAWNVASTAAEWAAKAFTAARDKRRQANVNVLQHAGIIVAGLRRIDRQLHRLFLPLLYFQPGGWSQEQRAQWINDVALFAHEDLVLPHIRSSYAYLLHTRVRDPNLSRYIEALVALVGEAFGLEPHLRGKEARGFGSSDDLGRVSERPPEWVIKRLYVPLSEDIGIQEHLPEIARLLRSVDDDDQAGMLRRIAKAILGKDTDADGVLRYAGRTIQQLASESEYLFGLILRQVQTSWPSIPAPLFVWEE